MGQLLQYIYWTLWRLERRIFRLNLRNIFIEHLATNLKHRRCWFDLVYDLILSCEDRIVVKRYFVRVCRSYWKVWNAIRCFYSGIYFRPRSNRIYNAIRSGGDLTARKIALVRSSCTNLYPVAWNGRRRRFEKRLFLPDRWWLIDSAKSNGGSFVILKTRV